MLDGADRVEKMRPLGVGEHDAVLRTTGAMRDRGQHERFSAQGRQPLCVAVYVSQLGAANVVVMKDRAHLARDKREAMTLEERLGPVTAVGQKSGRARSDGAFAHGRRFGEHALRVELVSPTGKVADPPAHR